MAADLGPCELIDGEVVLMSPGGFGRSACVGNIHFVIRSFIEGKSLGHVLTSELGLHVRRQPPRSRGADVAYISYNRLPKENPPWGFLTVPPELIVELSRDDITWQKVEEKIADYHAFGVDEVWYVDPEARTLRRFPRSGTPSVIHDGDFVDGGVILPGFRVPLTRFFDGL